MHTCQGRDGRERAHEDAGAAHAGMRLTDRASNSNRPIRTTIIFIVRGGGYRGSPRAAAGRGQAELDGAAGGKGGGVAARALVLP